MKESTQLKQQAQMLKAAFEEGWRERGTWGLETEDDRVKPEKERLGIDWNNSETKQMHDQLLMEAQGGVNVEA